MLDAVKLKQLAQASANGDWVAASGAALELSLESKNTPDEILVDSLLHAVQSQDADWLATIVTELSTTETGN